MSALSWDICVVRCWPILKATRPPSPQAEQKSLALLRLWLSPEQVAQYNSKEHFEVIGSDTGTRYQHPARQYDQY
jgi:hypothetical protein